MESGLFDKGSDFVCPRGSDCENSNFILNQINAETSTWSSSGYFDASKNFRSNVAEIPHQDPDQKEKYSCKLVNTNKPK